MEWQPDYKMTLAYLKNSPIAPFLERHGFVLLDGGLATELEKLGHDLNNNLWSAGLLANDPRDIGKVHRSYLDAGADCITAVSYQASIPGFVEAGYSEKKAKGLIRKAVDIASEARTQFLDDNPDQSKISPLVAASIGPYGAYLADGSEFRGDYSVTSQELHAFHEPRWEVLLDSPADLFAIETIPGFSEAEVLLDLLQASPGVFAWVSFSCADGNKINDGTPLAECAKLFNDCEQVIGVGVNCTAPQYISSLIEQTRIGAPGKPVVVYPNSGEIYDGQHKSWSCPTDPINLGSAAVEWFNQGASLLGGCCRTNPRQIADMKDALLSVTNFREG